MSKKIEIGDICKEIKELGILDVVFAVENARTSIEKKILSLNTLANTVRSAGLLAASGLLERAKKFLIAAYCYTSEAIDLIYRECRW